MIEDATFNQRFPAKRFARVEIETEDGNLFDSGEVEPNWEASSPPSDLELREKFRRLSREQLPDERAAELEQIVWRCDELSDISRLLSLVLLPVSSEKLAMQ